MFPIYRYFIKNIVHISRLEDNTLDLCGAGGCVYLQDARFAHFRTSDGIANKASIHCDYVLD
jgi:hypothetical protein